MGRSEGERERWRNGEMDKWRMGRSERVKECWGDWVMG